MTCAQQIARAKRGVRAGCAQNGAPVLRRGPDDQARRVGAMDRAHLPPRQGWRVGRPGRSLRIFRPWMDEKTQHRGGLLFGDFLLATQEKVTRAPGRRAEKDRDVAHPLPATSKWIPGSALRAAPE